MLTPTTTELRVIGANELDACEQGKLCVGETIAKADAKEITYSAGSSSRDIYFVESKTLVRATGMTGAARTRAVVALRSSIGGSVLVNSLDMSAGRLVAGASQADSNLSLFALGAVGGPVLLGESKVPVVNPIVGTSCGDDYAISADGAPLYVRDGKAMSFEKKDDLVPKELVFSVAGDKNYLYFARPNIKGGVQRVARVGGPSASIASGDVWDVLTGPAGLYYTELGDGKVVFVANE
jgi:hypothetical protein